jgi:Flp pilus assembly protein TadD
VLFLESGYASTNVQYQNSRDRDRLIQQIIGSPDRADLRYLLAAQFAAEGRYETAIEEMTRAISLDPKLYTAIFQLGLLHLTSGRAPDAVIAWRGLDSLGEMDPLMAFRRGLEALIGGDFAACARLLESGILANRTNTALNRDMAMVAARARAFIEATTEHSEEAPASTGIRTDFSLYDAKKS